MDFSSIIDTNMESNQNVALNRDERKEPIEIFDENNLVIDMVLRQATGAPNSKSTSQQKASQAPPSQRTSSLTVQKGTSRSRTTTSSSGGDDWNQEEESENEDQCRIIDDDDRDREGEMVSYGRPQEEPRFDMATVLANLRANHPCEGEDSEDENEEL